MEGGGDPTVMFLRILSLSDLSFTGPVVGEPTVVGDRAKGP